MDTHLLKQASRATKKRKRPGPQIGSGKFPARITGVTMKQETFDMLVELADIKALKVVQVARMILDEQIPLYHKQVLSKKSP